MSNAWPAGERDADIIPFPLHRVSQKAPGDAVMGEAIVHEWTVEKSGDTPPTVTRRAHNVSVHALSSKSHSVAEMRQKLRSRELPDEVIDAEIADLERSGLLDDVALAADLVERYAERDRLARRAIEQKLRARKLPESIIEQALAERELDGEDELAEDVARERLRKMGSLPPQVAQRRLYSYLQRKGFHSGDISQALERVLG